MQLQRDLCLLSETYRGRMCKPLRFSKTLLFNSLQVWTGQIANMGLSSWDTIVIMKDNYNLKKSNLSSVNSKLLKGL